MSIDKRPEIINNRLRVGNYEMELIEGKRNTNTNLLVLVERKTKYSIAKLINGKHMKTITNELIKLQQSKKLIFGENIYSITTDNGSEF